MVTHESEQSVFNMAFAYLSRIDRLLYFCQEAATKQNVDAWLTYLRAVNRELSVKLEDKEEEEIFGKLEDNKIDINNLKKEDATFMKINCLMNDARTRIQNKARILFLLDLLDIKIRQKLQKKGMLLPSKSDPRFAVTKR